MKLAALAGVHPMGECGLLVELGDTGEVSALYRALTADRPQDVVDLVPAERTLLVTFADPTRRVAIEAWLLRRLARPDPAVEPDLSPASAESQAIPAATLRLPVRYDGEDLAEVAELTGLSVAEIVAAHTAGEWTAAFCGFAPGFAYLMGGDPRLEVPRRTTPRTRVPAGSVALGGRYCGVYPRSSPGGWQVIGRTETVLWDAAADQPALIRPGTRVRFQVLR